MASSLPPTPRVTAQRPSPTPHLVGRETETQCGEGAAQGFHTRVLPTGGKGTDAAVTQAYALIVVGQAELSRVTFLS